MRVVLKHRLLRGGGSIAGDARSCGGDIPGLSITQRFSSESYLRVISLEVSTSLNCSRDSERSRDVRKPQR